MTALSTLNTDTDTDAVRVLVLVQDIAHNVCCLETFLAEKTTCTFIQWHCHVLLSLSVPINLLVKENTYF